MENILIYIVILSAGIFLLQIAILIQGIKNSKKTDKSFGDSKEFFQLKYRIDLIIAIVVLITAVATFYGLDTKEKIQETIDMNLISLSSDIQDSLNKFESKFNYYDNKFTFADTSLKFIENRRELIDNKINQMIRDLHNYQVSLDQANKDIKELQKNKYLQKNIYIVRNVLVPKKPQESDKYEYTIKFSNLVTSEGNPLPKFKTTPFVIANAEDNSLTGNPVIDLNTEQIILPSNQYLERKFSLIIIYPVN